MGAAEVKVHSSKSSDGLKRHGFVSGLGSFVCIFLLKNIKLIVFIVRLGFQPCIEP